MKGRCIKLILSKEQTESYAMEIYKAIFNLNNYEVLKFESPDFIIWRNGFEKIGFEVTVPSNQRQNELKNISNIENRETLGKKFNYERHKENELIYNSSVFLESNSSENINKVILENIEIKLKKLNKNYTLFDKNILCCMPIYCVLRDEYDHKYFIEELNKLTWSYDTLFNEIIIITYDTVIKYVSCNNKDYVLELSKEIPYSLSTFIQEKLLLK